MASILRAAWRGRLDAGLNNEPHCHSAKAASSAAETQFTLRCQRASKRARRRPTTAHRNSHHSAEPTSTPAIIGHGEATGPRAPSAPKMAMKEKIVAGLDSVSRKVPAKAPASPRASVGAAARSGGAARQVRQASHSMKAPPPRASGTRAPCSAWIRLLTPKAPTAP